MNNCGHDRKRTFCTFDDVISKLNSFAKLNSTKTVHRKVNKIKRAMRTFNSRLAIGRLALCILYRKQHERDYATFQRALARDFLHERLSLSRDAASRSVSYYFIRSL